jgi:hypothetical protein
MLKHCGRRFTICHSGPLESALPRIAAGDNTDFELVPIIFSVCYILLPFRLLILPCPHQPRFGFQCSPLFSHVQTVHHFGLKQAPRHSRAVQTNLAHQHGVACEKPKGRAPRDREFMNERSHECLVVEERVAGRGRVCLK